MKLALITSSSGFQMAAMLQPAIAGSDKAVANCVLMYHLASYDSSPKFIAVNELGYMFPTWYWFRHAMTFRIHYI